MGDEQVLEQRILQARKESRLLISHIARAKEKTRDATLDQVAAHLKPLTNGISMSAYQTMRGHFNKVLTLSWFPDSRHVVSGSQDGFMIIWDAYTNTKTNAIRLYDPWITSCCVSPNGRFIATGDLENACILYKVGNDSDCGTTDRNGRKMSVSPTSPESEMLGSSHEISAVFKGHNEYISDVGFISNSQIVTSSGDRSCMLWDLSRRSKTMAYQGHLGDVLALDVQRSQPDFSSSQVFVSCGSDRMANVWDVRERYTTRQYPLSESYDASAIRFLPGGTSFAVGSDDGVVRLLDFRTDGEIARYSPREISRYTFQNTMPSDNYEASHLALTPRSSNRYSSNDAFQMPSMNERIDNPGTLSLDFSISGRLMFVSYSDLGVQIWDTLRGEVVGSLNGHSKAVSEIRTSPDGLAVCTGSRDFTLKIWGV
ncbi:unnamed protein product [Kuraishia capsulata CBS 1993]|uniref:Uncharacterized protein n=1 Tax=Kuraishia capsulata CBS 1993 TaxID=1382522 RepID=W6MSS7_9ASCO|nr:uncharacterized protein KUCA_T00004259001 [Kuraishia capsulata CBS 1993]CDK28277.1 unnamed protein product [Kuraishia capsulata CBS 1993]